MADLLNQLDDLLADERDQVAYKHELAMSSFTNDIARLLAEQGVSQSELARRLGVSRARVSQLMRHASSPTLRTMVEVAAALGCDVNPGVAPSSASPVGRTVIPTVNVGEILRAKSLEPASAGKAKKK